MYCERERTINADIQKSFFQTPGSKKNKIKTQQRKEDWKLLLSKLLFLLRNTTLLKDLTINTVVWKSVYSLYDFLFFYVCHN